MSVARPAGRLLRGLLAASTILVAATATAAVSCSASTVGVNFGVYDALAASATESAGSVVVSCTNTPPPGSETVNYALSLSTGRSGSHGSRRMFAGGSHLDYNLFTNASRTLVWGDGGAGNALVGAELRLTGRRTLSATHSIYGRIPAQQDVAPGVYADTIVVTLVF